MAVSFARNVTKFRSRTTAYLSITLIWYRGSVSTKESIEEIVYLIVSEGGSR